MLEMAQAAAKNQSEAGAVMRTATTASRRLPRKRERPKALGLTIGVLVAVTCLAASSRYLASLISPLTPAAAVNTGAERMGKIVVGGGLNQCKQMNFDNESGRISEDRIPCDDRVVLNSRGVPIPQGTVHRLDAISKSFSGR